MTINCKGELIELDNPKIMGILNLTPDSFYDGGNYNNEKNALLQVEKMLSEGADFIDVGGSSTRPNASQISVDEELKRVIPILEKIIHHFPEAFVSIDTFYSKVAKEAKEAGVCLINDVSAGSVDKDMFETVAALKVPYVLSHIKGKLFDTIHSPTYENIMIEMNYFFSEKIAQLHALKVNDIVLDPGFGFTKDISQNYEVLKNLSFLSIHDLPILVGISRKSMLYKKLKITADESLSATSAAHMVALLNGANILRVHDVREAKQVVDIFIELK